MRFSMVDQVEEPQNDISSGAVLLSGPGIVVLSPSMQILHLNRQAHVLISDLAPMTPETQQSNHRTEILPPVLINLVGEILSVLRSRHEMSKKGQIEIRYFLSVRQASIHSRSGSAEWTGGRTGAYRVSPHGSKRQRFGKSPESLRHPLK